MDEKQVQDILAQYDLGDTGGDVGSTPVRANPPQQRQAGIPAVKATPPKDPETGRFLPAQVQPSAPNAQRQEASEDPLLDGEGQPISHSRTLLRHAHLAGFTDAEIDTTPSEQLQDLVFSRQQEQINRAVAQQTPNVSANPTPPPAPEPEPQVDFSEIDKVLDPEIATPLKNQLTAQLKQLKALEAKLEAQTKMAEQANVQRKQTDENDQMDRLFSEHSAFLGKKTWRELSKNDPDWIKRNAVVMLAGTDTSARSAKEKLAWAVGQLFGMVPQAQSVAEDYEPAPQKNGRPTKEEWANGGVPRPTQRKPSAELNDIKRARQAVQNRLEQLSAPGSNGTVDKDDFPE